jgi:Domain of unknown function (DUF4391)
MNAERGIEAVMAALALPADARVEQRVPKKLLLEQGAPTPADKRRIQDEIDEVTWFAALKPTNIGVPAYRDEVREYLEIAVIAAELRESAKASRLAELLHRAIPYPVVLIAAEGESVSLSLAHKRWSQGEAGAVVIDEMRATAAFRPDAPSETEAAFLRSLAVSGLQARDLFALYQRWFDRVTALEAAAITKGFWLPDSVETAIARCEALAAYQRLTREIANLRNQAQKVTQMNRRVDLNLMIKRLEAELAMTRRQLERGSVE